ncbi:phage tail sheath subtilisin-like domain-containing protein [Bombella apis]|uniref:phage tail sheath subtilisin-like domain-containing protein n=1 Tax=Bombella apis TaxID=1785988 RepID=UPI0024A96C3A|nr:phage tail sheath subtilisin-like domain-containing protein [Bombella apis]
MTVSIPGYDSTNRVPGFYFALDNSRANTAAASRRVLIIGQRITGTPGASGQAVQATGISSAVSQYGDGSQIAMMLAAYRQLDPAGEVWLLPLDDAAGSTPASAQIAISGQAATSGVLSVMVNDMTISVPVQVGDNAATVATSIATRLGQTAGLPVTSKADGATVTLTARNSGAVDNQHVAVIGTSGVSGVTCQVGAFSGGNQNPQLASILPSLGGRSYDLIMHPYADAASLAAFRDWTDNTSGRWSPMIQLYGQGITAVKLGYGQATAYPLKNDPHQTVIPTSDSPSHPALWAAWIGARAAVSMRDNPALPISGLTIPALPPSSAGEFDRQQRNSLLHDGFSTYTVSDDGTVSIERLITTYTTNSYGLPDNSYLDLERLLTAQVCLEDMRIFLSTQCGRSILLQNGSRIPAGARAVTPNMIAAAIKGRYRTQCDNLWCQDPDGFAAELVVENQGEGVVKALLPYRFADQLWVIAGNAQFLAAS